MCLYHVYHCPDNNSMIEKDNTSLLVVYTIYTSFIRSVCLYHVYHCPDNNGMIEKDNTSLLVVYTPVSSGQCVFIMYIIALITMVWLKMIIPAYLVVCIHQFHTPVSSGQCVFIMYIIALITMVWLKSIIPAYLRSTYTSFIRSVCLIMYIIALITMVW